MLINKIYYDFRPKTDNSSKYAYSPAVKDLMMRNASTSVINIPAGVKSIRGYCFYDYWPDTPFAINVPEGCEEIKPMAFANAGISSITLPSTITTIAPTAFTDTSLDQITINKPANSIAGCPWGADNEPQIIWKG